MQAELRAWTLDDLDVLLAAVEDPEVYRQLHWPFDEAAARAWISDQRSDPRHGWAISVDGTPVGHVGISFQKIMRNAWLSYWVVESMRGQGLATRAAATAATYSFTERVCHRAELGHRVDNPASGIVAERAGFVREGHERQKLEYDGVRYDTYTYGRLVTDPDPGVELIPIVS